MALEAENPQEQPQLVAGLRLLNQVGALGGGEGRVQEGETAAPWCALPVVGGWCLASPPPPRRLG